MKLNEIDFNLFNDKELIRICIKYKLIEYNDINKYKRSDLLNIIKEWVHNKLKIYGNQKSIKSVSVKILIQIQQVCHTISPHSKFY